METIAIRVEHTDGIGMFIARDRPHSVQYTCPSVSDRHNRFNTPYEDGIKGFTTDHFCAYKSVEQFKEWVLDEEVNVLIDNGFSIFLLTLRDSLSGSHQVVYLKSDVLDKRDITSLFV